MDSPQLETLQVNGIRMQVATQGRGPLVLLCHGFPELWCSWRAQMAALAAAGFRAAAPDMRGYGGTDAPADPAQYTMLHHVGDLVGLVSALGETQAVVVGHDWGAPAAWHAALLRPDLFRAVAGLSVPYSPPAPVDLLSALAQQGVSHFYMQYFQASGVAEAELEADVAATLRRTTYSLSGDGAGGVAGMLEPGKGFLHDTEDPAAMPAWVNATDLAYATAEFQRTGFRGGLNWYRAIRPSWELLAPWRGLPIRQPSLFIGGERDDVLKFPASRAAIARFDRTLPGLRGCHLLTGAGHWVQRERAAEVNALLLGFLRGL
ncbi:MAG: alpha/beta hydrolase [Betaproteobacteria bacterium]|nr:alpha/beta hydrolase [Betaproteobacteria bacterium]